MLDHGMLRGPGIPLHHRSESSQVHYEVPLSCLLPGLCCRVFCRLGPSPPPPDFISSCIPLSQNSLCWSLSQMGSIPSFAIPDGVSCYHLLCYPGVGLILSSAVPDCFLFFFYHLLSRIGFYSIICYPGSGLFLSFSTVSAELWILGCRIKIEELGQGPSLQIDYTRFVPPASPIISFPSVNFTGRIQFPPNGWQE